MRPIIELAFLDDVWCLKESSLSIHTPKSFSHVVSSSFTGKKFYMVSDTVWERVKDLMRSKNISCYFSIYRDNI